MERKEKNLKKIGIIVTVLIFIILIVSILCMTLLKKDSNKPVELSMNEFEKIATYNYLENYFFDVNTLYLLANSDSEDEVKLYQYETKYVLDEYFNSNANESSVSEEKIRSLLKEKFGTNEDEIDFHGIVAEGFVYDDVENKFIKDETIEEVTIDFDYDSLMLLHSNERAFVEKIEQISDNSYKVYLNIIDDIDTSITRENYKDKANIVDTAEVVINIEDGDFVIESCDF